LRKKRGKKPDGQADHPGQSLRFSARPDEVIAYAVSAVSIARWISCRRQTPSLSISKWWKVPNKAQRAIYSTDGAPTWPSVILRMASVQQLPL